MCNCVPLPLTSPPRFRIHKLGFAICDSNPHFSSMRTTSFMPMNGYYYYKLGGSTAAFAKRGHDFNSGESAGFKVRGEKGYGLRPRDKVAGLERKNGGYEEGLLSSYSDGLEWKECSEQDEKSGLKGSEVLSGEDLVGVGDVDGEDLKVEEQKKLKGETGLRSGRQLIKRSSILAKQVISIQTALSLGFVSQLWVDTTNWEVLIVEVRQNLLSMDSEKLILQDIKQVGDVVLIQDESMLADEFRMVGLETLVGYEVVTPGRRNIGKVRGYTFNIHSGAVESLEFDSFGFSVIPSSLVSTYSLFIEDVMEVISDTVIVHAAAASRIQRVTKGIWGRSMVDMDEEPPLPRQDEGEGRKGRRQYSGREKSTRDDWELPMDYL